MTRNSGIYRRRLGDWTLTVLNDGLLDILPSHMVGLEEAESAMLLAAEFRPATPAVAINAFLLQGHGRTVLIDTGGADMAPGTGNLLDNLALAGVAPETVDTVLLTHLHSDHYGMLAVDGRAVFPSATLSVAAAEAAFWLDEAREAAVPEALRRHFAAARAAVAPYRGRMRLLDPGAEAAPGITIAPLPGHTPGHSGYRVAGTVPLLVWGDIVHVPEIQVQRPEVTMTYDTDPVQAAATRHRVLAMAAAESLLVAGSHLHFPGLARVARAGSGYRLVPEPWSPGG